MPVLLGGLAKVGTAAMLWVGGGIIVHGLHAYHVDTIPTAVEVLSTAANFMPGLGPVAAWLVTAVMSAVVGLAVGGLIVLIVHRLGHARR